VIALLYALNILSGLFLVGVVLLQSGKGADMGAAFGGANSAVFGPSGPGNALTKITAATAALFMVTALSLSVISSRENSVFDGMSEPAPLGGTPSPVATPAPAAPTGAAEQADATPPTPSFGDQVKEAAQKAVEDAGGTGAATAVDTDKAADDAADSAEHAAGEAPAADTDAAKKAAAGAVDGATE